jgi:ADP-heptose:LPS heptosyltransferase
MDLPVCIAPGSGGRQKRWPLERWREVHARLRAWSVPVRWIAGPDEEDLADWPERPEAPTLPDLLGLAAAAGAWLGPDAGPQHLARAVGCPTGVVFGPTDPAQWAPPGAEIWPWHAAPEVLATWAARQRSDRAGGLAGVG